MVKISSKSVHKWPSYSTFWKSKMAAAAILLNDFYFLFWLFWEKDVVFYKIPNFDAFWTIGAKITLKNWFCHFGWDFPINPPKIEVFGGPRPQKWILVMAAHFRFCVLWTQHVFLSLCTKFHQHRVINGRITALRRYWQHLHAKMGLKSSFLGAKPPKFRGFGCISLLIPFLQVKCCRLISILFKLENVDFCPFFDFFAVPLTPKLCGFWGPVNPLLELGSFISDDLIPDHNSHHMSPCWLRSDD